MEKVRDEMLLTDEEIGNALAEEFRRVSGRDAGRYFHDISPNDRVIAQTQLEKILKHPRILIKAENQELPQNPYEGLANWISYGYCATDMLTPKDGCVWVRCLVPEKEE